MLPTTARHRRCVRPSIDTTCTFKWFTYYTLFSTSILLPADVWTQRICPSERRYCYVSANGADILWMQCDGYGLMNSLPVACNDSRLIFVLKVGQNNTLVTTLQAQILYGLQVQQLDLSGLGIQSIDQDAFSELGSSLTQLILSNNNISSLPDNVFKYLNHLISLDMSYNNLTTIGYPAIYGLFQVTSLDISHNQLTNLRQDTFSGKDIQNVCNYIRLKKTHILLTY